MKKPEELALMRLVLDSGGRVPCDRWESLTKPEYGYLDKWTRKGWWDYGVTLRSGWLTKRGFEALRAALGDGGNEERGKRD